MISATGRKGGTEYLNYKLSETDDDAFRGWTSPYYVRIINEKVDSYGRIGDFDSTKKPTIKIETDENIKINKSADLYTELRKLKELRDDGMYSSALSKYSEYLSDAVPSNIEDDIDAIIVDSNIEITERASLVNSRIGQGQFRDAILKI